MGMQSFAMEGGERRREAEEAGAESESSPGHLTLTYEVHNERLQGWLGLDTSF